MFSTLHASQTKPSLRGNYSRYVRPLLLGSSLMHFPHTCTNIFNSIAPYKVREKKISKVCQSIEQIYNIIIIRSGVQQLVG